MVVDTVKVGVVSVEGTKVVILLVVERFGVVIGIVMVVKG